MFQGRRHESTERNRHVGIDTDALVLSHAHIDHSGAIPSLVRDGYRGPIYATPATKALCKAMLHDCARIAAADARYANKKRRPDALPIEPIYTEADVDKALGLFETVPYETPFEPIPGVKATYREAGHIIGSAGVLLEAENAPTIYFTGDLGRQMYPILKDPAPLPRADAILSECTYGNREHGPTEISETRLRDEIRRCVQTNGKLLIPAFSVGRTQNLVYAIAKAWRDESLPRCPLFVDSPLAEKATEVFANHPECWDQDVEDFLSEGGRPFYPKGVHYISSSQESKGLNHRPGPFIVIAGSGMCEGGRIVHHLKHGLGDRGNTVLFVGWCAPHTLGRRILEKRPKVRIFGRNVPVRARVTKLNAYSAHADRSDLLAFLAPAREWGSSIYLVHGDESTAIEFADTLRKQGHADVVVPETYARYHLKKVASAAT